MPVYCDTCTAHHGPSYVKCVWCNGWLKKTSKVRNPPYTSKIRWKKKGLIMVQDKDYWCIHGLVKEKCSFCLQQSLIKEA